MGVQMIVDKFGGQSGLAAALGKRQSTVQHWVKSGVIPAKWHPVILECARGRGLDLAPGDFLPPSQPPSVVGGAGEDGDQSIPEAKWAGEVRIGDAMLPVYVLNDGRRVVSRTGATSLLTDGKGGGNLESYIGADSLKPFMPHDFDDQLIEFRLAGVVNKTVRGMAAETFLDICRAYARARDSSASNLTGRQLAIAIQANMVLVASAKVGLIALIDEATGYQYERERDALQVKLKLYLEEEMRKWERTFPEELWKEFGRLTRWKGQAHQRPKYWGKLVMELVYGYLDPDVAKWLKENAPKPQKGQNYHQWLSSQYGLKKLVEHLWMLIGMASACETMEELRTRMAERFGRTEVQFRLFLPPPW